MGLPRAYAAACGVASFRNLLPRLGIEPWQDFFSPARSSSEIALRRPFFPAGNLAKGQASQSALCSALGVVAIGELMRRCDRQTAARPAGECMFWTLGPKQVGKGAITGWRDVLQPAASTYGDRLKLWPFDGDLRSLMRPGAATVLETYPAEMYGHFGIVGNNKRSQQWRQAAGPKLTEWARMASVTLEPALAAKIQEGFGSGTTAEDDFDAVVGLFGMLNVILGFRGEGTPDDPAIRALEGWILGQS